MFGLTREEIIAELDPARYIGRCPEQVEEFLKDEVKPRIAPYLEDSDMTVEINL